MIRLCLFQPEIPQNVGTLLRLAACLNVGVDLIEPCGFPFHDRRLKRSGMDYLDHVSFKRHESWEDFLQHKGKTRLVALECQATKRHLDFSFHPEDSLVLGQEGTGFPKEVLEKCDVQVRIPMQPGLRSLNVAIAGAMVLNEALRQTQQFPKDRHD